MLAILSVVICFVLGLIVSFIMYNGGYKTEAIEIRNAVYGGVVFYIFLVLCIGAMPIREV